MNFYPFTIQLKKFRIFLLLSFCVLAIHPVLFAQSSIGFQIGKSYSRFDVKNENTFQLYEYSNKFDHTGYSLNAFYTHSFLKYFCFKPRLGYAKRGVIILRDPGWVGYNKFSLRYIDFSAKIGYAPIQFITLNGGISYNYLINASGYSSGLTKEYKTTNIYRKFDLGYNLGLNINIKGFVIEANYFKSLLSIRDFGDFGPPDPNFKTIEHRNESIEFSIGYQFSISKKKKKD